MMKSFKVCAVTSALFAILAFAQEPATQQPTTESTQPAAEQPAAVAEQPAAEQPAEPAAVAPEAPIESAPEATAQPAEPVSEPAEPVPSEAVAEAPAPEPVVSETPAASEPAPVATAETVSSVATLVAKSSDPLDIKFHAGVRLGAGASLFRNHKAFYFDTKAIKPGAAFSVGAGIAFAFEFNEWFSLAPELQYTLYRTNGEYSIKKTNSDFMDINEAGVRLHALELPVLCRFNIAQAYAELGPQIGLNLDSRAYKNSEAKRPDLKTLAFGPSIGGGVKIDNLLVGVRGYLGILEYAKNTNGYPWVIQVSATQFFF